jgi:hypothetical protein
MLVLWSGELTYSASTSHLSLCSRGTNELKESCEVIDCKAGVAMMP